VVELVMLPGLDGTGRLFRPLVATLSGVEAKVVSYPNDKALSLDEHARWVIRHLPDGKAALLAESFSGLVALRVLQEALSRIAAVIFVGAFAEPPRRRFSCDSYVSAGTRRYRSSTSCARRSLPCRPRLFRAASRSSERARPGARRSSAYPARAHRRSALLASGQTARVRATHF
jgi:pimeloyl-ACP methyl ester carboxylesterase